MSGRPLDRRHLIGVSLSVIGLVALAISLARAAAKAAEDRPWASPFGSAPPRSWPSSCSPWGAGPAARRSRTGSPGGLLFSIGDISTKLATQGGVRFAFVVTVVIGYTMGTSLLQLGYQRGGALTVAGLATLLTNALPIAAGTTVLHEPVPGGALGAVRIFAFAAVTISAILLAAPEPGRASAPRSSPSQRPRRSATPPATTCDTRAGWLCNGTIGGGRRGVRGRRSCSCWRRAA